MQVLSLGLNVAFEGSLVDFKSETILQLSVLADVQPRAVGAGLPLLAVIDNPLVIVVVL